MTARRGSGDGSPPAWDPNEVVIDAERAVLAAMILDAEVIPLARELITAPAFYLDAHRKTFEAILVLHGRGEPSLRDGGR